MGLSLFNTVILYYKIGLLILHITALEARIDLREMALGGIECILLVRHAELIVQLGTVIMLWLKLSIGITVDAHVWVYIDVDILGNVLNGIVVMDYITCVRLLLLTMVELLLLLIIEVILVTDVWVKLIHEWISLYGKWFHSWLLRKLVNLNLFSTLHFGATAIRNLIIIVQ